MTLNFYIDPAHYPYQYETDISFSNAGLVTELGSANTWLLWTLRTYLELKDRYNCVLTDRIPDAGITLFFRGSVSLDLKPSRNQFWICMVADSTWHPYSHVNLFQNQFEAIRHPQSWFIRHWYHRGIKRSVSERNVPLKIYYFGDAPNLASELNSPDWKAFLELHNFDFVIPHFSRWHDYSDADIVLGIRPFQREGFYYNKPSSKLINAWHAGVVFIGGTDSAYAFERKSEFDFIEVDSYETLKSRLIELKNHPELYNAYRKQAMICAGRFPESFFLEQWIHLLDKELLPVCQQSLRKSLVEHYIFLVTRFITYRRRAFALRLRRILN